jgi:putative membrane protein
VLNAFILMMLGGLSESFGLGFQVSGFFPAFVGALIVTVVSLMLLMLVTPKDERRT